MRKSGTRDLPAGEAGYQVKLTKNCEFQIYKIGSWMLNVTYVHVKASARCLLVVHQVPIQCPDR